MNPILEQIRKLRALSKSDNEHEAAAAAAAAEKIIAKHGIAEAMLDAGVDDGTTPLDENDTLDVMASRGFVHWKSYLLSNLCDLHGCAHCYTVERGRRLAVFFGRPDDVEIVKDLYAWLSEEVERLTKKCGRGKPDSWKKSYRLGCVRGISDAMEAAQEEARKKAPSTALAVLDARLVEAARLRDKATDGAKAHKAQGDDVIDEEEVAFDRGRQDGWEAQRSGASTRKGGPKELRSAAR